VNPFEILGIRADAREDEIRAAYLARVRDFPPDRSPEQFEKVRDAYEQLHDVRARIRHRLFDVDPAAPLSSVFAEVGPLRRFVGPGLWIDVLKGK
jgi:DnaJ-class molecular chaperone